MTEVVRGSLPLKAILGLALGAAAVAVPLSTGATRAAAADASAFDGDVAGFYRARAGTPLWFGPNSGAAAQQLVSLLATAQADHLNPKRYNVKALSRALDAARGGDRSAVLQIGRASW